MSSGDADRQAAGRDLAREMRQFQGLSASVFRAAAARRGMTVADMQVIDLLENTGPAAAGQLADLTGLTTGAITALLNRLEEAGMVRRERDPADGRRVIARPVTGAVHAPDPVLAALGAAWDDLAAQYGDEEVAIVLAFLRRCNALCREALIQARVALAGARGAFSAPLGDVRSGRLVVSGALSLKVRADDTLSTLYQARFDGPSPDVRSKDGVVTIRSPRRWLLVGGKGAADVRLSTAVPWKIVIQGGGSQIDAHLGGLNLTGLDIKGGASSIKVELPVPTGLVPVRIGGDASEISIRRPAGVAARAHLKGWASGFVFDGESYSGMGNNLRLHSPDYDATAPRYEIHVASSAGMVIISAG